MITYIYTLVDPETDKVRTEAAKFFKIEPTHITRVCKGKSKSGLTKGHYFKYL